MTSTAVATIESAGVAIDHQAILKSLNLDVRQPATQALLLICDRYGLDPLLKHIVLIQGSVYVTRDGYLAIAHKSGVFDGMEVLEQGADGTHYTARVAVYRKDMGRPFTFIGRYPKAQRMAKEYGPEMAVKVAEVQALRRAFNVTGVPAADEQWADDVEPRSQHVEHLRAPTMATVVDTKELPPSTGARKAAADGEREQGGKKNPYAQGVHILAAEVAKVVELDADKLADLAVSHATGGKSTSANDLTRATAGEATTLLYEIRDRKVEVAIKLTDGVESYRLADPTLGGDAA